MAMQKVLEEEQFKNICLVVLSLYLSSLSGLSGLSEMFGVAMAMKKPNAGCMWVSSRESTNMGENHHMGIIEE